MQKFLKENIALREVLSPDQIGRLHAIATDLQRSETATAASKAAQEANGEGSLLRQLGAHGIAGLRSIVGFLHGGVGHGAAFGMATE